MRRSKLVCCKPLYDMSYVHGEVREEAMIAGAKEIGVLPSIVRSFPRKTAALILDLVELLSYLKFLYRAASTRIELLVSYISHCRMRALLLVSMFRFPPISDNDNIFLFLDLLFFMDDCLERQIDRIYSKEELHHFIPSQRISKLAHPLNVPASFKQRAMLVDENLAHH
ncbi:hypothetical protein J1N35_009228 [Gossypium stocksii]|uniref:Uncharacterized protein n=1 Tax=Gossypium stocksii TaxID=47602 RepID=A0A9D3W013_9ROSI|nr:hypothetical protein J1N35_009228 [Gossypium stocksii]